MQNAFFSVLLDVLMAALLIATMVYCRRLNGRIKILQDSRSELARIIRDFDESTQRATQSIADIHAATDRISENIQHKIDKANFLADDLQYMIEKGQRLAGKAEPATAAAPSRPAAAAAAPFVPSRTPASPAAFLLPDENETPASAAAPRGNRLRSRAEQEIMSALGGKQKAGE
jgi:hypothetical protein